MAPHHDFVPGCTYLTCTFCGRRRLFPDELALCDDKKFRCLDACMEKSIMSIDREIAASHYKREAPPLGIGYASQFDRPLSFLETAAEFRSVVLAGWTPTTTFYDDFSIVPGGVGSSWTTTVAGVGTVTQPEAGVARFTTSGVQGEWSGAKNASVVLPAPGVSNCFCAVRFRTVNYGLLTSGNLTQVSLGVSDSVLQQRNAIGMRGVVEPAYYSVVTQSVASGITSVEKDTTNYHTGYMWWKPGSAVFGSIDGSPVVTTKSAGSSAKIPLLIVLNFGSVCVCDVTDYVVYA